MIDHDCCLTCSLLSFSIISQEKKVKLLELIDEELYGKLTDSVDLHHYLTKVPFYSPCDHESKCSLQNYDLNVEQKIVSGSSTDTFSCSDDEEEELEL
jgi:hypothetical protein